jgi:hypothetical protein
MEETNAMCDYAMANGLEIPAVIIKQRAIISADYEGSLTAEEIGLLASIHQRLNRIVSPATPQALALMARERNKSSFFSFIGAIPIIRHIILISIMFLIAFILVGQLEVVNEANLNEGILGSFGWVAIAVLSYLISCAGLGACFTSLYRLNSYVSDSTYDPRYDSTYWASILLGVIAGLFISELLYAPIFGSVDSPEGGGSVADLGKPALALLGGFSANMVYKVLQRIVESFESLFKGDQSSLNKANRATDLSQLKQKQDEVHMEVASRLLNVNELLTKNPEEVKKEINSTINNLLGKA